MQWGLDVLFNPSKRHLDEEKRRMQSTRPILGDSSGGKRIDLDSGKVRIPGHKAATAADSPQEVASSEDATSEENDD